MSYVLLEGHTLRNETYEIVSLREQDIMSIKEWRNAQIDVLRQKTPLTDEDQRKYFLQVIQPTFIEKEPRQILVSILLNGELIGYGGLVHMDWEARRAEVSFLVATERANHEATQRADFSHYLQLIKQLAFDVLHLNRLTAETFNIRPMHIQVLEENGFLLEGILKQHAVVRGELVDSICHGLLRDRFEAEKGNLGNVLVTSLSGKFSLIEAVKKAAYQLGIKKIFGGDASAHCLAKSRVGEFWQMPRLEALPVNALVEYCQQHNIMFIIPTRDGELAYFAEHKKELAKKNIFVMVSNPTAVQHCLDKVAFYDALKTDGLTVVETALKMYELKGVNSYVIKERNGAGSRGLLLNASKAEAMTFAKDLNQPIFQPFIEGKEFSADVYVTKNKEVKGVVLRWREVVVNGESKKTTTFQNKEIENTISQAALSLGLYGHAVLQGIVDKNKRVYLIEANCRFGGASTLSLAAGLNSFVWFIAESVGGDINQFKFVHPQRPLTMIKGEMDIVFVD